MGHNKQTTKPGFSLEVDNQAPLFTDAHAGWEQGTCHKKQLTRVFHLQVTEESQSCETPDPLFHLPLPCHTFGGARWYFLGWLKILLKQEFTQRGLEFSRHDTASKAYRELPCKVMLSHVTMDPHSWSSRLRKIHTAQSVLGLRQQHGQMPGGSAEGRLVFTKYSSWLLPMKAASEIPFISASLPTVPRQQPPALVAAAVCDFHSNLL